MPFSFADQALLVLNTLSLAHGIFSINDDGVGIMDDSVEDRVSECALSIYSCQSLGESCEAKMVDPRLCPISIFSKRSRASCSESGIS